MEEKKGVEAGCLRPQEAVRVRWMNVVSISTAVASYHTDLRSKVFGKDPPAVNLG